MRIFKRKKIKHNWKHALTKLTENHKHQIMVFQCEDCRIYKEDKTKI